MSKNGCMGWLVAALLMSIVTPTMGQATERSWELMLDGLFSGGDEPLPPGVPALMMVGQFDEFGGAMRDRSGRESWEGGRDALIAFRTQHESHLGSIVVEPGAGHFAWSDRNAKYLALFIRKAAQTRIPAEMISWVDAAMYCSARSDADGLQACYNEDTTCNYDADGYRLPTESEWEYACRAGTTGDYYFDNDSREMDANAWSKRNSRGRHHPVGTKQPNEFGLHDMAGNLCKWCDDLAEPDKATTGFLYGEIYLRHKTGSGHPERPERLRTCFEIGTMALRSHRRIM